jgi:hypothetical protein
MLHGLKTGRFGSHCVTADMQAGSNIFTRRIGGELLVHPCIIITDSDHGARNRSSRRVRYGPYDSGFLGEKGHGGTHEKN